MNDQDTQCPVCGYYCLGKGGIGCIDKPELLKVHAMNDQSMPTMELEEAAQVSKVEFDNIIANAKAIKDKIYLGLIPPPSKAQAIAMIGLMIRMAEQGREDTDRLREIDRALDDVEYAGFYEQGIYKLKAELAKFQESSFNPDWSMLQASQESLREHMLMLATANEQLAAARDSEDAERFVFLFSDHDDPEIRERIRHILENACVKSVSNMRLNIDAAIAAGKEGGE